jgi:hypothetical protein
LPFHLALRLGVFHPDYLLPFLSARQLLDWQEYHEQFGLGLDRGDTYEAMLLSLLFNVHRGESTPARNPTDFLLWNKPEPFEEDESQEEFVARIRAISARIPPT